MMTTVTDIRELAGVAYDAFERRTRPDGEAFTTLKDDAPEWVQPIVRDAHGGMLPDDWRYECTQAAFEFIRDYDDPEDHSGEFADAQVDTYNASRLAWLSSNLTRQGYVDDAVEEMGYPGDIMQAIGYGQYAEAQEVFGLVLQGLREYAESVDDDEEDDQ